MQDAVAEEVQQPAAELPKQVPICPYCQCDPLKISLMFQTFPQGQIASIVFCNSCRKHLATQIVGMTENGQIIKPGTPRIV